MSDFARRLIDWQQQHGRHGLPWQHTCDPYRVWLSEIMLQQTQVDTVIPYYQRFLQRFPDVAALAAAPAADVMALWSGLGYYARARNLHRAAQCVVTEHGGAFPRSAAEIASLPGIGRSTAAAIAAFCFGERAAILDGNVKRVLARHAAIEGFPGQRAVELQLWSLAEARLPASGVAVYTQAMMDLGATICTRSRPDCGRCPVATDCQALLGGRQAELPTPKPRKAVPERATRLLLARNPEGEVLLETRPAAGIWGGLCVPPEIPEGLSSEAFVQALGLEVCESPRALAPLRHVFTHFKLDITPVLCEVQSRALQDPRWSWAGPAAWARTGLPAPVRRILAQLGETDLFSQPA
ncbi:A/G-specific adenine glycosylase [Niveibacterium sp. SC-1]|uniref:A/G-specific adenine glycosylase n=1 Tax=Niveibacterium sp. SC-1 TaxID=3135646 RepID=UPI00311E0889